MNLQELATAAEEGVNVKVVLLNNAHLGLVHQQQTLFYGGRYVRVAIPRRARLRRAIARLRRRAWSTSATRSIPACARRKRSRAPGPCLIHVPIAAEENVYPMVPPGAANTEMILSEA